MRIAAYCAALTGVLASVDAGPASAQNTTERDLWCVAVFAVAAGNATDDAPREALETRLKVAHAGMGLMYFLGRLEGRDPSVVWLDRLRQQLSDATMDDLRAHQASCGALLEAKGRELQEKGKVMQDEGAKKK